MATKAKARPQSKARRSTAKKAATQYPQAFVANARFEPGAKVGFWPAADVGVERAQGQRPFPKPAKEATVGKDGSLKVTGLAPGSYVAAAETGEDGRWTYLQFSVKAD